MTILWKWHVPPNMTLIGPFIRSQFITEVKKPQHNPQLLITVNVVNDAHLLIRRPCFNVNGAFEQVTSDKSSISLWRILKYFFWVIEKKR